MYKKYQEGVVVHLIVTVPSQTRDSYYSNIQFTEGRCVISHHHSKRECKNRNESF